MIWQVVVYSLSVRLSLVEGAVIWELAIDYESACN